MRSAMRGIRVIAIAVGLCVVFAGQASAQHYGIPQYGELCPSMLHANAADMVQFLNTVKPDDSNKYCVTYFILSLGDARYEPAISALIKLLDFVRPETPFEARTHTGSGMNPVFPAQEALWEIARTDRDGSAERTEKVLSALLDVMKAESSSLTQIAAAETWMQIYQWSPEGVARLRREQMRTYDTAARVRLLGISMEALGRCVSVNSSKVSACLEAVQTGTLAGSAQRKP